MAPRVWLAAEEDAGSVAALMGGFRDHMSLDQPADDELRATVEGLVRDPATEFLLAAPDDRAAPAAVCQLRYRLAVWTGTCDCWLEDLYVDGRARRAGLGRALVDAALERARARGCRRIALDVEEDNSGALALYREMGFEKRTLHLLRRL